MSCVPVLFKPNAIRRVIVGRRLAYSGYCALLLAGSTLGNNSIIINETSGRAQANRPTTISRVFAQGEIANYPRPSIAGTSLPQWQSNVMNRWPDGSVKHVLITFGQTMAANASITVLFVNDLNPCHLGSQSTCDASAPNQASILGFNSGKWDASIETTQAGTTHITEIRDMISAGKWRFWIKGPLWNEIIVEDRSPALAYDYGYHWDTTRGAWAGATVATEQSLHPMFVLTEYTGWAGVKVQYILENTWADKLQSQTYSVTLRNASALSTPKYIKSNYNHVLGTRWRKVYWDGSEPGSTNVDYNSPYMISTMAIPNFDLTKTVPPQVIDDEYSWMYAGAYVGTGSQNGTGRGWIPSDQCELGGHGEWDYSMDDPGGRPDIGLFPRWDVSYLYTMAPKLYTVVMGNAECSAFVANSHFRDNQTGAWYDPGGTTDEFGHTVSRIARPGLGTIYSSGTFVTLSNGLKIIGPNISGKWANTDVAHQPSFAYLPYLLTGDWYFLEEMYYWAAFSSAFNNPDACDYCGHGSWAFLNRSSTETRGQAWGMRNIADAWFMAPDGDPEKLYFRYVIDSNIAIHEGEHNITTGSYYDPSLTSQWYWGRNTIAHGLPNPLHFPESSGVNTTTGMGVDAAKTCYTNGSPWMYNFLHIVYGRMEELGLSEIHPLRTTLAANLLGQLMDSSYSPYLAGAYKIGINQTVDGNPAHCPTGPPYTAMFATFNDTRAALDAVVLSGAVTAWASGTADPEHGYPNIARAAASFMSTLTAGGYNGSSAWNWILGNANNAVLNNNPKWALVPRSTGTISRSCDVNSDSMVNVLDVQAAIGQILGSSPCITADVNGDGRCDVLDLQIVANATLGNPCK